MRVPALLVLIACSGDPKPGTTDTSPTDGDADTDADADADGDGDGDADADTDSDTDVPIEPVCADATADPLTSDAFLVVYREKICFWWDGACALPGNCPSAPAPSTDCAFDPVAACACLDGAWSCDGAQGRPTGDPACDLVYDCPVDTGWVTDTGATGDSGDSGDSGGSGR